MTRSLFTFLIFLILLTASCSTDDRPDDLIEEERYVQVFTELVVINQITDEQLGPVSRDYLTEQVFEKQGVTESQFDRTHQYYQRQPDRQLERISKVEEKLTRERDQFQERLNSDRRAAADSAAVSDTL